MRYNKWQIVKKLGKGKVVAQCDCGTIKEQWLSNLSSGKSTQCIKCQAEEAKTRGTHFDIGGAGHPLYNVWSGIKRRCYNKNQESYKYYGAKGVAMCDEWRNDYRAFYSWMMDNGYEKGLVVSRNGDKGNYEPSNCKVKTFSENSKEAEKYIPSKEEKHKMSLDKSGLTQSQYDEMIKDCTSGRYVSNEMVSKYNIDRHTIIKMLKRMDMKPTWRRSKFTLEQIASIRKDNENGVSVKDLVIKYKSNHETIGSIINRRLAYKDI